jgi:hypothetical protein
LVESIGKERVDCVEFSKLLLEDEHVVHIIEDPVEVGRKKERLHFFNHVCV